MEPRPDQKRETKRLSLRPVPFEEALKALLDTPPIEKDAPSQDQGRRPES